jgi:hypothetical protein
MKKQDRGSNEVRGFRIHTIDKILLGLPRKGEWGERNM